MYAVIKTGGKQYRVAKDDVITIERLAAEVGDTVAFPEVLMLAGDGSPHVGKPTVAGASVAGEVVEQTRGDKVIIFKKRRRHNYRRKKGHRQELTVVRILDILTGGAEIEMKKAERKAIVRGPVAGGRAFTLLKSADGKGDDLSLIGGIGPKLNERLKSLGIFHFWQLAALSDADIAKIETGLAIKGRIDREEWVEQSRELMAGKAPRARTDRARVGGAGRAGELRAFERLDVPEGNADDLSLIGGVGDKIVAKLNDFGVHHFWQVAALEAHDVEAIESEIGFKGRIGREEWVEQARELMAGKAPRAKVDQDRASKD